MLERLDGIMATARRVLEPSCGTGAFIEAILRKAPELREVKAFELQAERLAASARLAAHARIPIELTQADIFDVDLRRLRWSTSGPLLVIGNPPWITSAALGAMQSENVPRKRNVLAKRGIDALTGSSNFDITEHVWWKLLTELSDQRPTIALLCKTSVARRVLELARGLHVGISGARLFRIDARKWFGASVDACLFTLTIEPEVGPYEAAVYDSLDALRPSSTMGFVDGHLVNDIHEAGSLQLALHRSPLVWRQGLKHDVASVMELIRTESGYRNGLGETVDVEPDVVYPLLKGSDLHQGSRDPGRAVIVTQRTLSEDPIRLATTAPKAWQYLSAQAHRFDRRKSSIYQGRPKFAMFGVGPYSFSLFKIGVAGLYPEPRFRLIGPLNDRPVMLDDTCYFLAVENAVDGALLTATLNHHDTKRLLSAISFSGSKRPITKKVLQRVDPYRMLRQLSIGELASSAEAETRAAGQAPKAVNWIEAAEGLLATHCELPLFAS